MKKSGFIIVLLILSSFLNAQKSFEGIVLYDISYENLAPEMEMAKAFLPNSATLFVDGEMSKIVTPNGAGETVIISNSSSGEVLTLTNTMGNKFALKTDGNAPKENDMDIEHSDETMDILGYSCKKALFTNEVGEIEVYYTKELDHIQASANTTIPQLDGFVMKNIVTTELFTIVQTVTKIEEKKVEKISLEIPDGYSLKTMEEVQKMMGQ